MAELKRCTKCKTVKDVVEFCKDKSKKDGLHSACSGCNAAYDAAYNAVYRAAHREEKRAYDAAYNAVNQLKISQRKVLSRQRQFVESITQATENLYA